MVENKNLSVVSVKAIPENDTEILFLEKYNVNKQGELEELDILKFNDELMDFIEAKGYKTKAAFNLPVNNISSVKIIE